MTASRQPFKIAVPDEQLKKLKAKLDLTTFPDELEDAGWNYGVPLADIRRLVTRWKDGYDWRKHESALNDELPQFTTDIDVEGHGTLNIHYVHKTSNVKHAIPLLFVHGWPGSFVEVRKILPLLTESGLDHPSFHVVAIGLPGYGFSEAPKKKGFRLAQYAEVSHKLMLSLGYKEYVTQGGDWGRIITMKVANTYGGPHCKAWHTNFPLGRPPRPLSQPFSYLSYLFTSYSPRDKAGLQRMATHDKQGRGYFLEQATQPQTIGYNLTDSPVGLLAWIYEKLVRWTDNYPWEDDEVLDWISLYYFSRAGPAASVRIYYEIFQNGEVRNQPAPTVPAGLSYFPKEIEPTPLSWTSGLGPVVLQKEHDIGGHFASHERPDDLVSDLRAMFGKGGPCFGVVPGKNGYAA
ncbi:hypothetical protein ONZ45_g9387 [Pleurotus djamor]|nr:hypothetical protein ONZ45_g9387 [Pleurotus djamor]